MENWKDSFDADRMRGDKAFSVPLAVSEFRTLFRALAGFEPSRMTLGRCL